MTYTEKNQLAIIQLYGGEESISIEEFRKILTMYPSNVVYCELHGKLVGIISTGDALRAYNSKSEDVRINKEFVYLYDGEYMKARTIFEERKSVNAIPVVTEDHVLIGDYTRWDDLKIFR